MKLTARVLSRMESFSLQAGGIGEHGLPARIRLVIAGRDSRLR